MNKKLREFLGRPFTKLIILFLITFFLSFILFSFTSITPNYWVGFYQGLITSMLCVIFTTIYLIWVDLPFLKEHLKKLKNEKK